MHPVSWILKPETRTCPLSSDLRHPTSVSCSLTSDLRHQTSEIRHLVLLSSSIQYPEYIIQYPVSSIQHPFDP
ncbi:hypothetical protein D3OALGB2SA_918 [Olavius algarvensis associated proteobacterium Delta 3]|nr:hypothetical protein D3OALGB2SA_918 [Olavius algarvensis associated proteobacterium Delta 3]